MPLCAINNIPALVQIMAWRLVGAKPWSESMTVGLSTHIYICVTQLQWVNWHVNGDKLPVWSNKTTYTKTNAILTQYAKHQPVRYPSHACQYNCFHCVLWRGQSQVIGVIIGRSYMGKFDKSEYTGMSYSIHGRDSYRLGTSSYHKTNCMA